MIDLNGKTFRPANDLSSGDVGSDTLFEYRQDKNIIWATYSGETILHGTLIAKMTSDNSFEMRYQHIDNKGQFKAGICNTVAEADVNGKVTLHEKWQWTDGALGSGETTLIEV